MATITIVGRLTRDPERRVTRLGEEQASLNIAEDQGDNSTVFYHVSAYAGLAKNCLKVLTKGWKVQIVGQQKVKETNGKTYHNVSAYTIEFLCPPKREQNNGQNNGQDMNATPLDGFEDIQSKDIPF